MKFLRFFVNKQVLHNSLGLCVLSRRAIIHFSSLIVLILSFSLIVFPIENVSAETTEDVVEGAGEIGKFAMDVVEDFGLEGKTAEESGKARLEGFLKGKAKDFIKDRIGPDLSEGMDLILNKIYAGILAKKGRNACELAALNQAWGITFDAKNTRLTRGAANIWFDILTSIPGAPALAEKLVTKMGETAYKKLRSQIEGKIKEWWAKQKDEAFKLTKKSGPCTISMTVLWNKKKNKYLFLITGKCDCKLVPIEPLGRGGTITMKSFQVIGGGSIKPVLDVSDPKKPKVKLVAYLPSRIKIAADCDCAETTGVQPPKEKEDPIEDWITAPRMQARVTKAKCEACQWLLNRAIELVGDFNKLADTMDSLAKKIKAERYKTPARDANIEEWKKLSKKQDEIEKKHDKVFRKFFKCEKEECNLGTGTVWLDVQYPLVEQWTDCTPCIEKMKAVNKDIKDYNKKVETLNGIASYASRAKLKFGTVEGNKAYKRWHKLRPALDPLNVIIQKKIGVLSACIWKHCRGASSWQPWPPLSPMTGTCTPCISHQEKYNKEVKKYNAVIDKLNKLLKKQREYLEKHGDKGAAKEGYDELNRKEDLRGLLKAESEGIAKLDRIKRGRDDCVLKLCDDKKDDYAIGNNWICDEDTGECYEACLFGSVDNWRGNNPYDPKCPICGGDTTRKTVEAIRLNLGFVIGFVPLSCIEDGFPTSPEAGCPETTCPKVPGKTYNHLHDTIKIKGTGLTILDLDEFGCGHGCIELVPVSELLLPFSGLCER